MNHRLFTEVTMEYHARLNHVIRDLFVEEPNLTVAEVPQIVSQPAGWAGKESRPLDQSFLRLGDTYLHLKNHRYAMECYREALRINPGNIMAFNRLILIPDHLFGSQKGWDGDKEGFEEWSEDDKLTLALNDTFRQTFLGGYILLSKAVSKEPVSGIRTLLSAIQKLGQDYFDTRGGRLRNHGSIVMHDKSYFWMINHCDTSPNHAHSFALMVLMTREEYGKWRTTLR